MSEQLFVFTIGPVQEFIVEARRAHDLWAGSRILVELTSEAAKAVRGLGADLIYPANPNASSVPNRFVAKIPDGMKEDDVIDAAEGALQKKWEQLWQDALKRLDDKVSVKNDAATFMPIWERQVKNHLEVYWALCASEANEEYGTLYHRTMGLLSARKRTRIFEQTDEAGAKDSLSGMRSALHRQDETARDYWKAVSDAFSTMGVAGFNPTLLKPNGDERLDAIGATKRFSTKFRHDIPSGKPKDFPSVSSIAAASFRRMIKQKGKQTFLGDYAVELDKIKDKDGVTIFRPGDEIYCGDCAPWGFDGDLLYMDTLTPKQLEGDYHLQELKMPDLRDARASLRKLYGESGARPSTYYAILEMDGDNMGEVVGGCKTEEEHRKLSERLASVAEQVTEIVEQEFAGRVVYAGGDDLLAFLPLADALPAAKRVREVFGAMIPETTISAGIALSHHQSPLDAALGAARRALKDAKDNYARDAMCVYALKRSGEHIRVGSQWQHKDAQGNLAIADLVKTVEMVIEDMSGDKRKLSTSFPFDVWDEAETLASLNGAFATRIAYLLNRHKIGMSNARQQELVGGIDGMTKHLTSLFERVDSGPSLRKGTVEMSKWLLLARFVAQGGGD